MLEDPKDLPRQAAHPAQVPRARGLRARRPPVIGGQGRKGDDAGGRMAYRHPGGQAAVEAEVPVGDRWQARSLYAQLAAAAAASPIVRRSASSSSRGPATRR